MIINLLITIALFLILMWTSVNLLGLLVRGLFTNPELEKLKENQKTHEFIKNEIAKSQRADKWVNIIALILIIGYLYTLFHFWNIGVVLVAIMIMSSRLPDLLWEIKHGKRIVVKSMPKDALYYITTLLIWGALPILYYSLYIVK